MFRAQQNAFDDAVAKATDENLTSENWEFIMDVVDKVGSEPTGGKDVVASLIKRLAHRNANVQLYTLEVCTYHGHGLRPVRLTCYSWQTPSHKTAKRKSTANSRLVHSQTPSSASPMIATLTNKSRPRSSSAWQNGPRCSSQTLIWAL